MFCPKCGKEISDDSRFCEICGTPIQQAAPAPQPIAPGTAPQPAAVPAAAPASSGILAHIKTIGISAKVAVILALVAFFMPFVTISCNYNDKEEDIVTYSAMDMITMDSYDASDAESAYSSAQEDKEFGGKFNLWITGAFAAGVASIVLVLRNKKTVPVVLDGVGALLVILTGASFDSFYGLDELNYIESHLQCGFYFMLLMFLAAGVLQYLYEKHGPGSPVPTGTAPVPPPPAQIPQQQPPQAPPQETQQSE